MEVNQEIREEAGHGGRRSSTKSEEVEEDVEAKNEWIYIFSCWKKRETMLLGSGDKLCSHYGRISRET